MTYKLIPDNREPLFLDSNNKVIADPEILKRLNQRDKYKKALEDIMKTMDDSLYDDNPAVVMYNVAKEALK